jgi:hypothetical protein
MLRQSVFVLILGGIAWGQNSVPATGAAPKPPAIQTLQPSSEPQPIAPDAAVITLQGVCDKTEIKSQADCKTIVTKAEFEKIADALDPNMAAVVRRRFAMQYARALTLAARAHELGLDQGQKYEELVALARIQALAQLTTRTLQEKATQVSAREIEDYYQKNLDAFQEATLERVFVPRNKQLPPSKVKLTEAASQKRVAEGETVMKAKAETLRARAIKGEKLEALQAEAFQSAGLQSSPPTTQLGVLRSTSLPPNHQSVFELRAGEISPLILESTGYYFYKMDEKKAVPIETAREDIRRTLAGQRMQEYAQELDHSSKTTLNENYFPAQPVGTSLDSHSHAESGPSRPPARVPTAENK